jgi:predicted DNA-binding antitoxin AbrB/MazE fold protein
MVDPNIEKLKKIHLKTGSKEEISKFLSEVRDYLSYIHYEDTYMIENEIKEIQNNLKNP